MCICVYDVCLQVYCVNCLLGCACVCVVLLLLLCTWCMSEGVLCETKS